MKLALGLVGMMLGTAMLTGCGPGLGHHGKWANAPSDQVGQTELTSASLASPAARESGVGAARSFLDTGDPWSKAQLDTSDPWMTSDAPAQAEEATQTWGAAPKPEDKYGF